MAATHTFTKKEEIANAITHGLGVLLSVAALVVLIVFALVDGNVWHVVSFSIYGATMLMLYTCSTLLHSFPQGRVKDVFEIFDHASIYLFIAGTYTPVLFILVKGGLGWTLFGIIWGLALGGTVFKVFFIKRFLFLSTFGYIAMGWLAVFILKPILAEVPAQGAALLVTGGVLYTLGSVFFVWRKVPYHHAIWHVFVLAGSICHFFFVLLYILPVR
jgi:hemolysin III